MLSHAARDADVRGKIVVVTERMVRTQDGAGIQRAPTQSSRRRTEAEAAKLGAVGFLMRSIATDDTPLPRAGGADAAGIPAAALAAPDADLLERMSQRGQPVIVRLDLTSSANPAAPAWNVVGEIRGSNCARRGHRRGRSTWIPGTWDGVR